MSINKFEWHKFLFASFYLLPFLLLYLLSKATLSELYLFEWLLDKWYLYVWVVAMVLAYKQKHIIALFVTISSIGGVPLGQFWGDYMRNRNIQLITDQTPPDREAYLRLHHGVSIWIMTVILFTLVGILFEIYYRKTKLSSSNK